MPRPAGWGCAFHRTFSPRRRSSRMASRRATARRFPGSSTSSPKMAANAGRAARRTRPIDRCGARPTWGSIVSSCRPTARCWAACGSQAPATLRRVSMGAPRTQQPAFDSGAFSCDPMSFLGGGVALSQAPLAARSALAGFAAPEFSVRTPWGVPAFFMGTGPRGNIGWNRFEELRGQLDLAWGLGQDADWYFGGELVRQRVRTFQRVLAYLPVGDSVPPPTAADFRPTSAAAYSEWQLRASDVGFTIGAPLDPFPPPSDTGTGP